MTTKVNGFQSIEENYQLYMAKNSKISEVKRSVALKGMFYQSYNASHSEESLAGTYSERVGRPKSNKQKK